MDFLLHRAGAYDLCLPILDTDLDNQQLAFTECVSEDTALDLCFMAVKDLRFPSGSSGLSHSSSSSFPFHHEGLGY